MESVFYVFETLKIKPMEINKVLELGLEWAEKRMASELTRTDKEYIITGIKASLVKNCSIPNVVGQNEQLKAVEKLKEFAYEVCPLHREDDLEEIVGTL